MIAHPGSRRLFLPALLSAAIVGSALSIGGGIGLPYVILYALACLPGLPLGWTLFGSHPAAWIAGSALGYAATSLGLSVALIAGPQSTAARLALFAVTCAATTVIAFRARTPLFELPRWSARSSRALVLLLLLVPLLMVLPLSRLGEKDDSGARRYRAYFTADFAWHTALTEELTKDAMPPKNPYLGDEPVHYYWAYFLVPAALAKGANLPVESVLKVNALLSGLILVGTLYVATWAAMPKWPMTCAVAAGLTTLAASLEGLAAIADVLWRGLPIGALRDVNVDAVAAWAFKGVRIDNLPRTLWYTPQHGFACALGLVAVPILLARGTARPTGVLLVGCALGGAVAFSPLIGVGFCAVYGVVTLADLRHDAGGMRQAIGRATVLIPVAAAVGWCLIAQVGEGAAGALRLGFWGLARNATLVTVLLQLGPLLALAIAAWWSDAIVPRRSLLPASVGIVIALAIMHLVSITVDLSWAGFRGGNLFFAFVPAPIAAGLAALHCRFSRRHAAVAALATLAAGLPTTAIDLFNAQDTGNLHLSRDAERARGGEVLFDPAQEFHWTLVVPADSLEALTWLRTYTPPDALVQAEPTVRGRESWSLIPSLAARRSATGIPVPLLNRPIYQERNGLVRELFATEDSSNAWTMARALGIDYLYADAVERAAYSKGVDKFEHDPAHFEVVFRNRTASVYAVRP